LAKLLLLCLTLPPKDPAECHKTSLKLAELHGVALGSVMTPKHHLLTLHTAAELSQLPSSSNTALSACGFLAVSMGLAVSG